MPPITFALVGRKLGPPLAQSREGAGAGPRSHRRGSQRPASGACFAQSDVADLTIELATAQSSEPAPEFRLLEREHSPALAPRVLVLDRWGSGQRRSGPSRQRPRRRGPFRRVFPVASLSDSSLGSPFGLTRSGSTSPLPSPTSVFRSRRTGDDECGRPTCDAGGSSCGLLF